MSENNFDDFLVPDDVAQRAAERAAAKETLSADDILEAQLGAASADAAADDPVAVASLEEEFRRLAVLRRARDAAKERAADASKRYEAQLARMQQALDQQGTRQFRSAAGLGSCYVEERYDTIVEDPGTFEAWAKQHAPELFTIHAQTRTSYVRRQFRDLGVPDDDPRFPQGLRATTERRLKVSIAAGATEKETA